MIQDEMVGWHHQLNGHEFEQTLGDGEGQGSLACCRPQGGKESDMTEGLNTTPSEAEGPGAASHRWEADGRLDTAAEHFPPRKNRETNQSQGESL